MVFGCHNSLSLSGWCQMEGFAPFGRGISTQDSDSRVRVTFTTRWIDAHRGGRTWVGRLKSFLRDIQHQSKTWKSTAASYCLPFFRSRCQSCTKFKAPKKQRIVTIWTRTLFQVPQRPPKWISGSHEFSPRHPALYEHGDCICFLILKAVIQISVPELYQTRNGCLLHSPFRNCLNRYLISERPT